MLLRPILSCLGDDVRKPHVLIVSTEGDVMDRARNADHYASLGGKMNYVTRAMVPGSQKMASALTTPTWTSTNLGQEIFPLKRFSGDV